MKATQLNFLSLGLVLTSCSAATKVELPVSSRTHGGSGNSTGESPASESSPSDRDPANSGSSGNQNSNPATTVQQPGNAVQSYSFAEAQQFCVNCHSANGSASSYWNKADGTEADWKAAADSIIRPAVQQNMPFGNSAIDKSRFYAFLDSLTGVRSAGSTTGGSATVNTPLNFQTAQILCTSCHGPTSSGKARTEFPLSDSNSNDWKTKKSSILSQVNANKMPPAGFRNDTVKKDFISFVNSL